MCLSVDNTLCCCDEAWCEEQQARRVVDVRLGLLASDYWIGDGRTFVAVNVAAGTCSCGEEGCGHVQAVVEALGEAARIEEAG